MADWAGDQTEKIPTSASKDSSGKLTLGNNFL